MKRSKNHGSGGRHRSSYFNSYPPPYHTSTYRTNPAFSIWMYPSVPGHCPRCGIQIMNLSLLGAHMNAHLTKFEYPLRPGLAPPAAGRASSSGSPQAEGGHKGGGDKSGAGGGASSSSPPVALGVLEPRVDSGAGSPQTLDLLGPGGNMLQGGEGDDSKETTVDLESHKDEEEADSLSDERKKKQKI